jgi:hypothetical protein
MGEEKLKNNTYHPTSTTRGLRIQIWRAEHGVIRGEAIAITLLLLHLPGASVGGFFHFRALLTYARDEL